MTKLLSSSTHLPNFGGLKPSSSELSGELLKALVSSSFSSLSNLALLKSVEYYVKKLCLLFRNIIILKSLLPFLALSFKIKRATPRFSLGVNLSGRPSFGPGVSILEI